MNIEVIQKNNQTLAYVSSSDILLSDTQSALDLMATVKYDTGCSKIILDKQAICEDFFRLGSGLAGEILQKYINYGVKLAIVGDYSGYTSKPLKDFIYESNHGKDVFFLSDFDEAAARLADAL